MCLHVPPSHPIGKSLQEERRGAGQVGGKEEEGAEEGPAEAGGQRIKKADQKE